MALMKMKKIREMSEKEMSDNLNELRLELSKDRGASEIGTVKSPGKIRAVRKSIARIKTVINEKGNKGVFDTNKTSKKWNAKHSTKVADKESNYTLSTTKKGDAK